MPLNLQQFLAETTLEDIEDRQQAAKGELVRLEEEINALSYLHALKEQNENA